jgi:hypothetical protein
MVPTNTYYENLAIAEAFARVIPGDIVECGTWKGGMACGLMAVCGGDRIYHFFDSFEGLPDAREIDGPGAINYQKDTQSPVYFDNCRADYEGFCSLVYSQDVPKNNIHVYKGWFSDTLVRAPIANAIAVLRLDADWYESTWACLESLYPKVARGGVIIVDDYYMWDGCSRAVHAYLHKTSSRSRVRCSPLAQVAYIIKED